MKKIILTSLTAVLFTSFTFAQSISIGGSPSGIIQIGSDIKKHFEISAGFHKIWPGKSVPAIAIGFSYKFKPVKTFYISICDIINYAEETTTYTDGSKSYRYYNAYNFTTGYQFNFWKRFDLRLGVGIDFCPGISKPVQPDAEVLFGLHFKKFVQIKFE